MLIYIYIYIYIYIITRPFKIWLYVIYGPGKVRSRPGAQSRLNPFRKI